jgi:hypothetical protein
MAPISRDDFQVGEWQVCPALNEITRGDEVRHLEPKVMDVLCYNVVILVTELSAHKKREKCLNRVVTC